MNSAQILEALACPGAEYRLVPFWFWNGAITPEQIDRQLLEMARKGIGGVAISPRQGMDVPYLSARYFELFRHAALSAARHGLFVWIYDEFPYPSGVSGGEVLMRRPSTRQTRLAHYAMRSDGGEVSMALGSGVVLDVRAVPLDEEERADWERALDLRDDVGMSASQIVFQEDAGLTEYNAKRFFTHDPQLRLLTRLPAGRWRVEACVQQPIEDFKYFNGFIDPCDSEASACFLETTHERYRAAVGDLFGSVIRGVFTDETGLLRMPPWSRLLPQVYREMYGEALEPQLCRLFDRDAPGATRLRCRYYRAVHALLRENYHRPVAQWCRDNGLAYIAEVPGMRMTTQIYSDVVGGDFSHEKLGVPLDAIHDMHTSNYRHNPTAIASLARQKGASRALVECFHSIGWSMTLQDARWGLDYLTACGDNQFSPHAFFYSTAGLRKYDAPPSQFFQNPYWEHYRLFADYAARNALICASTRSMGRVAILEPTTTLWSLFTNPFDDYAYGGEDEDERREHERVRDAWRRARRALFHAQISFDHLDPEMLALAEAEGGELRVGSAVYTVVIVTHSHVAEPETLEKLRRFRSGGGCVCLFGDAPSRLTDGKPLREAFPASIRAEDEDTLCRIALENAPMPVQLCLSAEGWTSCVSCLRETESAEPWLFVANQEGGCVRGTLRLRGDLTGVERIHCDGRPPQALRADAEGVVPFEMGPYEAAWFRALRLCAEPAAEPAILRLEIRGDMSCRLLGRNLLRMEQAQVRMHGAEWTRLPLRPYGLLREALGALEAGSWRASSGFGLPRKLQFRYPHTYQARMTFHAEFCPPDLELFYERESLLGEASVSLNGTPLPPPRTQGDQVVFPIAHAVRVGSNELVFSVTVRHDWEGLLDAVFLRGDFSLSGRTLRPPVRTCECSCAYPEGAPFYSGAIEWSTRFDAGEAQGAE